MSGWFFAVVVVVYVQEIREGGEGSALIVSAFLRFMPLCGVGVLLVRTGLTGVIRSLIILHLSFQHRLLIHPVGLHLASLSG